MYTVTEISSRKHIDDLVLMGRVLAAENGPHLDFEPEEVIQTCQLILNDVDREMANFFLVYKEDEPVGFIFAVCGKYIFNKQRYAQQELLFIRPAFRGTRAFLMLLRAFEEWARLRGAVEIWTGAAHSKSLENILPRIGYPKVGSYHKKRTV